MLHFVWISAVDVSVVCRKTRCFIMSWSVGWKWSRKTFRQSSSTIRSFSHAVYKERRASGWRDHKPLTTQRFRAKALLLQFWGAKQRNQIQKTSIFFSLMLQSKQCDLWTPWWAGCVDGCSLWCRRCCLHWTHTDESSRYLFTHNHPPPPHQFVKSTVSCELFQQKPKGSELTHREHTESRLGRRDNTQCAEKISRGKVCPQLFMRRTIREQN